MFGKHRMQRLVSVLIAATGVMAPTTLAQEQPPAAVPPAAEAAPEEKPFKQEELEQMLAPIALYPDSLLTQILMACTYPLEIVEADRWVKANKTLKGDALAAELEKQEWDASVKSMVNFPDLLAAMSEKLKWTTKIGDAFISDQKRVLDTIQALRAKAKAEGNLESNDQQTVTVTQENDTQVIVIESSKPEVVYVPSYDPVVVYGGWSYPSYPPPAYYYPPGYVASSVVSFGVGVACGLAWGYAWGHCDWGHSDVDIDIDRNTEFNRNIDRDKAKAEFDRSSRSSSGERGSGERGSSGRGSWQHDSSHRKGVSYRDQATARQHGGTSQRDAQQARSDYRGRTGDTGGRGTGGSAQRTPSAGTRDSKGGAVQGSRSSGSSTRQASDRGQSSRSGSARSSSGSSRSGSGSRGGGSRGGGSRGGGGGRGGRR